MPPAVSDLIVPERTAGYVKGRETRELILRTALNILIEHGWQAMSMRRIAADCGMKFGNLTYHYRTREDLVRATSERAHPTAGTLCPFLGRSGTRRQ